MAAHPGTSSSSFPVTSAPAVLARTAHATHTRTPRGLLRLFVPLALVLAFALAACGGSSGGGGNTNGNTLVFGAPVSLTGSLSHEGTDTLNGYKLWAETVNAHGGIKVGSTSYQVQI